MPYWSTGLVVIGGDSCLNPSILYWMDIFVLKMFARKDENKRKEARNGPPRVVVQVSPIFTNPLASFTQAFDVNLFCTLKIAIKTFHANFWQLPPLINSCRYTFLLKPCSVKMYFLKFVPSESLFDLVFILNPYGAVIGRGLPVVLNGPVAAT